MKAENKTFAIIFHKSENVCVKDTHREEVASNKTPTLTKMTTMGIWVVHHVTSL